MIERITTYFYDSGTKAVENGRCNRCFGKNTKKDYQGIEYCLDCFLFKEVSSSMYLIRKIRNVNIIDHQIEIDFPLSQSQQRGSQFLVDSYEIGKDAFLHAVCGAGKTEMALEVIKKALNKGDRVAFVIPRVEIIKQVVLRISSYLPKTKVCALYGGEKFDESFHLIILTPQQLIKFYREFDLMIIDEVDAFPFVDNLFLQRLIKKAQTPNAKFIYMSATISSKYQAKVDDRELLYHMIPRRFHNRDLAVPIFIQAESFKEKKIVDAIKSLTQTSKKLIVYIPSIKMGEIFYEYLQKFNIDSSLITSNTKYKASVLKDFKSNKIRVLISSTILERGVTFDDLNVIVVETDNRVFSESTLIQIAGRVGRKGDDGVVIFYAKEKSIEMIKARKKIMEFNQRQNEM